MKLICLNQNKLNTIYPYIVNIILENHIIYKSLIFKYSFIWLFYGTFTLNKNLILTSK